MSGEIKKFNRINFSTSIPLEVGWYIIERSFEAEMEHIFSDYDLEFYDEEKLKDLKYNEMVKYSERLEFV